MECEDCRSTIQQRGVCGVPVEGGACQEPQGKCVTHTEVWRHERELAALREQDGASCITDRGRCAVVPRRGGAGCRHPRTRCPHHASEQERGLSMVDRDAHARCWNRRVKGTRFCTAHADYHDFSVTAQRWIRECQRTRLPLEEEKFMAHVCAMYPDAPCHLPKIHDFQKNAATFECSGLAAERSRSRSPKRS